MHTTDRASRLKYARERARFESPRAAARHFRWNENTYKAREGGMRDFGVEDAIEYGRAFDVSWVWLASGEGDLKSSKRLCIKGIVSTEGIIDFNVSHHLPDDMAMVELDWALPDDAEALQVVGNSMLPKYDNGDIIIIRNTTAPVETMMGEFVVATCENSKSYLRRIQKGSTTDRYDLETFNAPTIKDARVSRAGFIILIAPGKRIKHLSISEQARKNREDRHRHRLVQGGSS